LNIKPCMGQISGTWELLLCEYWRKSMIIGEKNMDLKRLTGRLKLCFLTEIGQFHWNLGKEVPHFAWFGEPCRLNFLVVHVHFVKGRGTCGSGERNFKIWIDFRKSPRFSLTSPLSQERERSQVDQFLLCMSVSKYMGINHLLFICFWWGCLNEFLGENPIQKNAQRRPIH
jgi:hypothetical protein